MLMDDSFQRLFARAEPQVLSMNAQAALGPARVPKRSQFTLLLRHFLERFFNHETASPDGDAKTRLVQIACAAGLPPFIIAVYLWPIYHPIAGWPPGQPSTGGPPPYWLEVNHHFFFVVYSFVAMGIATVFEWDLFFPDLLDLFVLGTLPIAARRSFFARVAAIAIFTAGFLFDANILAAFVLPMATDPPILWRFLAAHLLAVGIGGLFASVSVLALQGLLLSVLGEPYFRKIALFLQGAFITSLVMLMLLFPVLSGVVPVIVQSGSIFARWFPPFWFLGIYQRILEGPTALPIYTALARSGYIATLIVAMLAILSYPLAYLRKVRQIVVGSSTRSARNPLLRPLQGFLHRTLIRLPVSRAVFHFISQTLLRVPRYRIYLVLYGGVGISVVAASVLRFTAVHQQIRVGVSAGGLRAAVGIVVFWMVAGLRVSFASSGNERGRWVFRVVHGNPPQMRTAKEQLHATKIWVLIATGTVTFCSCLFFRTIAPEELLTWPATESQALMAAAMCLILTETFFNKVTAIPFTGERTREQPNLAMTVLKYFTFFPLVSAIPLRLEPWMEMNNRHFLIVAAFAACIELLLLRSHHQAIREHCNQMPLEEDEEDFPMKLGLRY